MSMQERINEILLTLTPREEKIIKMLFGFNSPHYNFKQVRKHFQVSGDLLKMIIKKAKRKLESDSRKHFQLEFDFNSFVINDLTEVKQERKPLTLANHYAEH